jgi:hypothetical protein
MLGTIIPLRFGGVIARCSARHHPHVPTKTSAYRPTNCEPCRACACDGIRKLAPMSETSTMVSVTLLSQSNPRLPAGDCSFRHLSLLPCLLDIPVPQVGIARRPCYNAPVPSPKPETRIIECKRCGIHTRHEREERIQRPLPLLLLTGQVKVVTTWRCTKCGKRRSTRTRYAAEEGA